MGGEIKLGSPDTLDAELAWEDAAPVWKSCCYYYVRVTQADDEQAWSSPVWVDIQA